MDKASEAILALQPVTFRYKKEIDPAGTQQFGLVAEEVEKVSSDLVVHGEKGKPYSVRYDQVNAMLLNEFLKEHQTVQELKREVAALTAGLQKVSAQVEASKPAPQVVKIPKQQHFTISRHASRRGGLLFHAVTRSPVFEIARVLARFCPK